MRHVSKQRGQTAVEFVLVLPLLLVLVFLVFEVGRLFGSWLLITNAAREGARYASVQCIPSGQPIAATCPGTTNPTAWIEQQVQNTASFLAIQAASCNASGNPPSGDTSCIAVGWESGANSYNFVTVAVSYQIQTLMPITGTIPVLGKTINYPGYIQVTGISTMHAEY
jgi:Flp pilus assembly protein TadG